MHSRLPVVLLSVVALAAPGATTYGKDKNKGKKEQKADDRTGDRDDNDRGGKITICHIPPGNRSARHTISVGASAWPAHQGHGDHRGACGRGGTREDRRFDEMDANRDGVISLREWRGDRVTFDRLDRNDNGVVSRDEFSRY